jgi:chromosome segregation ATPase
MSETLEAAAIDAIAKVKSLESQFDESDKAVAELKSLSDRLSSQLDDWNELRDQVASFKQVVEQEKAELATEAEETAQALAALRAAIDDARAQALEEIEDAQEEVATLGERASAAGNRVGHSLSKLTGTLEALAEGAQEVASQLEQNLSDAEEWTRTEVPAQIQKLQEAIEDQVQDLESGIADCKTELQGTYDNWDEQIGEVADFVKAEFEDTATHAREAVEMVVTELGEAVNAAVDDVLEVAARLVTAIDKLTERAREGGSPVEAFGLVADQAVPASNQEMDTALQALDRVKERLAALSFMG